MELKVELSCPLGHRCEHAMGDTIYRCAWFTHLRGKNPQTGEEVDERGCAIAWVPILQAELARTAVGTTAAVESFRNEMVQGNQALLANSSHGWNPLEQK